MRYFVPLLALAMTWWSGFVAGRRWMRRRQLQATGEERFERTAYVPTLDITAREIIGASLVPLRHNTDPAARN